MRRNWILGLVAFFAIATGYGETTLEQVADEQEAKLEAALHRLREVREVIRQERIPLTRELNALDARGAELDEKLKDARRLRDSEALELESLKSRVEAQEREIDYVTKTLLPSFVANFDATLSPAERGSTGEMVRHYNLFLENPEATEFERMERGLQLLSDAVAVTESQIGGKLIDGEAIGPDGRAKTGTFVQIGPLAYFANDDLAGIIETTGSIEAYVTPFRNAGAEAVSQVVRTGEGILPIDPSLGDAIAVSRTKDTVTEHLVKGGVWVIPILLFALAATVVAIVKSFQIFSVRHPDPRVLHEIVTALKKGNEPKAHQLAEGLPQPARDMLVAAVAHADESMEMVEEVMYESMLAVQPKLDRGLNVIAVTAAAAPLLGLLGTVTGIIKTFQLMTVFGAGDPKPLISGISEALITTELGLILAIPALVLHALLSRKVAGVMARLEKAAVTFVNGLSRNRPGEKPGAEVLAVR